MSKFWVIAGDVYKKKIKSASFAILILAPFLFGVFFWFINNLAGDSDLNKIGIFSENAQVAESFTQLDNEEYQFVTLKSEAAGEKQLEKEDIDAYLVLALEGEQVKGTIYAESSVGTTLQMTLQQMLNSMQRSLRAQTLGLSPEEVAQLDEPASFTTQKVSFDAEGKMEDKDDYSNIQSMVAMVATILLLVFIMTYASIIAQEIASEKGTRIMEIILSSTKAQTHYYGKLVGVLLVALTQMVIYGLMIVFGWQKFKDMEMVQSVIGDLSIEKVFGPFLIFTVIFVLLGILIYSVLAALCGSLVNKAEDTAKAIVPVTYLSMAGYFIAYLLGLMDPHSAVLKVTSYIPFFSSFSMPVRLASDTATIGNGIVSVVILLVVTLGMMFLSAGLYKSNVLVYNDNGVWSALKQSWTLFRSEQK
ncbi:ABC transporter permease [Enterococcus asini]|uniref:ABC transporter permease n=1 Tax=Enterococcus asini TaxID=57732 RepID=A0AAW8U123_9ENTE|nr:ABC transporter permease [Enterococcus asini]MDT2809972.1 ABC transporter permease [Enterococcus asini]